MEKLEKTNELRGASNIQRCHNFLTHDVCTVGKHCWNVVSLLLVYNSNPSLDLIKACQFHDVHELYTGDIPSNVKFDSPDLGEILTRLENDFETRFFGSPLAKNLTEDDYHWLKLCDVIELMYWCAEEFSMGNKSDRFMRVCYKVYVAIKQYLNDHYLNNQDKETRLNEEQVKMINDCIYNDYNIGIMWEECKEWKQRKIMENQKV